MTVRSPLTSYAEATTPLISCPRPLLGARVAWWRNLQPGWARSWNFPNIRPAGPDFEKSSPLQNLFQRFAFGELVDQLVQIADLLHQRVLHRLDAHAAHHTLDQRCIRMDGGRLGKETLKVALPAELFLQT